MSSEVYVRHNGIAHLYRWAMSQYLPYSKFKWLNQKEIDKFYVNLIIENSSNRYILEVDFEYPDELHECMMIVH